MNPQQWLLSATERGNDHTVLTGRRDGAAWSSGNHVRALVHGRAYFAELLRRVSGLRTGDLMLFTDWRGDPDECLDGDGTEVGRVFAGLCERGVVVKGLVWRSHWDRLQFSAAENRHLEETINAAGGECIRDMRVRIGGSHHQKFVVLRHPGRPELDVAFVGGIDLCHSRNDDADHSGDRQRQGMAPLYGDRPPWHDVQLEIRGPAVADLEACFRERWADPTPVTRNPIHRVADAVRRDDDRPGRMPAQLPDPDPVGSQHVQVLRTYPFRRRGYPFAPRGEFSVARAYGKAIRNARSLIYVEDQYFWADEVVEPFADALRASDQLKVIVVIPHYPDQGGRIAVPPNLIGRERALDQLRRAGPGRVAVYGVENHAGTPVYVHAKVCVVDDVWASVGSDNFNRRSWTHDSELSCAVVDDERDERPPVVLDRFGDGARRFARELRLELACEHLDRAAGDDADLIAPDTAFERFRSSAEALQDWHDGGRTGTRPPGRLRPYRSRPVGRWTAAWAGPLYRTMYDPDGRPYAMRRRREF